jgi:hypothetical protein
MAELNIKVSSPAMPISTEFFSFCKGLEQFYYLTLLGSEAYTGRAPAIRNAWLASGFHLAGRIAPPVDKADKVRLDSHPGVKGFEVTLSGGNREALGRLGALLADLDAARKSLPGQNDAAGRLAAILANRAVDARLIQPLKSALAHSQIPPEGIDAFMLMIRRGLAAITDREITSIEIAQA